MLNVIEDTLRLLKYPVERIDGDTASRNRQLAIDRFMAGQSSHLSYSVLYITIAITNERAYYSETKLSWPAHLLKDIKIAVI